MLAFRSQQDAGTSWQRKSWPPTRLALPAAQRNARVAELMERFSLVPYAATRSGLLSGGWQQRLSLAVALLHRPELLVLDEPTVAVNIEARMDLWVLIEGLRDSGTTILLTSHHLAEAQRLLTL